MAEKEETMMEDWQYNKLSQAVCKRKESIPELLKTAGIAKENLTDLTKQEATKMHYFLNPDAKRKTPAATQQEVTVRIIIERSCEYAALCDHYQSQQAIAAKKAATKNTEAAK